MTVSVAEQNALLERTWKLRSERDFVVVAQLLESLPQGYLLSEPELGYALSLAWLNLGEWKRSLDLARRLEGSCVRRGNDGLFRRRMNVEAMSLYSLGRLAEAKDLLLNLLEAAGEAGDEYTVAAASNNLGVIATVRCRWEEGLLYYQRAIAAFQRLGDANGIGSAHQNVAMTYRQLGRYREADTHFQHALRYHRAAGDESSLAGCEMERALLLHLAGDPRLAEITARRALGRYRSISHLAGEGDSLRVLGVIAAGQERYAEAKELLQNALLRVQRAEDRLAEAETCEELAVLEQKMGNAGVAASLADQAAHIYSALGAAPRAERLRIRLAETEEVRASPARPE